MPTCSIRRRMRKNECGPLLLVLACGILALANIADAQIYVPQRPPEPSDYGKVILDNYSATGPGRVVFDHWLHRSKFTCRLCHVDIGFAMQAKATGVTASTNRNGFHCGACHDGKKLFDGRPIFAACSDAAANDQQCDRCHSLGKKNVRKYEYGEFTAKFPKGIYGVDWEEAEKSGALRPLDFIEGLSVKKTPLKNRADFGVEAQYPWVHPITFSHEKHSVWNGCELCHPEIFPLAEKGTAQFSMFHNVEGQYCGACHGKVAFPLNNCQRCHARAPLWVP